MSTIKRFISIFFMAIFTCGIFIDNITATPAELKEIKELGQKDKNAQPEIIERPKGEYKADSLRDPFKNPQEQAGLKPSSAPAGQEPAKTPLPALTVQGLIWGGSFPQAIINNKVVKIGDIIQGVQVTAIDKSGVTVSFQQVEHKLPSPAASGIPSTKPQGGYDGKNL